MGGEDLSSRSPKKKYRFYFQGAGFTARQQHHRKWLFKFVHKHFDERDYLRFTDPPHHYESMGVFDHTLTHEPGGLHPKKLAKSKKSEFDAHYYEGMATSNFTMCPGGDTPWSMRFYEAALAGSIPVIHSVEGDLTPPPRASWLTQIGYEYLLTLPFGALDYRQEIVDKNRKLFLRYQTFMEGDNDPSVPNENPPIPDENPSVPDENLSLDVVTKSDVMMDTNNVSGEDRKDVSNNTEKTPNTTMEASINIEGNTNETSQIIIAVNVSNTVDANIISVNTSKATAPDDDKNKDAVDDGVEAPAALKSDKDEGSAIDRLVSSILSYDNEEATNTQLKNSEALDFDHKKEPMYGKVEGADTPDHNDNDSDDTAHDLVEELIRFTLESD